MKIKHEAIIELENGASNKLVAQKYRCDNSQSDGKGYSNSWNDSTMEGNHYSNNSVEIWVEGYLQIFITKERNAQPIWWLRLMIKADDKGWW